MEILALFKKKVTRVRAWRAQGLAWWTALWTGLRMPAPIAGGAETTFTAYDGVLRMYDAGSPVGSNRKFIEIAFVNGDFRGPLGRPDNQFTVILNRGRHGPRTHYVEQSDEVKLQPVDITWSFRWGNTDPNRVKFRAAMNIDKPATWIVGPHTWVSTKGTTPILSGGENPVLHTTLAFPTGRRRTADVYLLKADPSGTTDAGMKYGEVEFPAEMQNLAEGNEGDMLNITGKCYGEIIPITAFPAGAES